jgi:hypothetical protein
VWTKREAEGAQLVRFHIDCALAQRGKKAAHLELNARAPSTAGEIACRGIKRAIVAPTTKPTMCPIMLMPGKIE